MPEGEETKMVKEPKMLGTKGNWPWGLRRI